MSSMHVAGAAAGQPCDFEMVSWRPDGCPLPASTQARHMARLARYVGMANRNGPVVVSPQDMDWLLLSIQELCLGRTFAFTPDMLHLMVQVLETLAAQIGQQDAVMQALADGALDALTGHSVAGGRA